MNPFPILSWSVEAIFLAFGMVVILAVLAYGTHLIALLLDTVKQFFGRTTVEVKAAEALRLKQKEWFTKHANIYLKRSNQTARTVTLNRFIIDAIDVDSPKNAGLRGVKKDQITFIANTTSQVNTTLSNDQKNRIDKYLAEDDCDLDDYNLAHLMSGERAYEGYIDGLGIGLGGLCICDSGYCDWEEEIFTQFIVDTTRWNFKSASIYKNGELISTNLGIEVDTSSFSGSHVSPDGTYLLVVMDPTGGLLGLGPGDVVKVVFEWCDKDGTKRCAVIYNGIPGAAEVAANSGGTLQNQENGLVTSTNKKS